MPGITFRELLQTDRLRYLAQRESDQQRWLREAGNWLGDVWPPAPTQEQIAKQSRQTQAATSQAMAEVCGMQATLLGQRAEIDQLHATSLFSARGPLSRTRSFTSRLDRSQVRREQFMKVGNTGFAKWSKQIELETMC